MRKSTAAVILAAGQGKRMRSKTPKVLHNLADLPLVAHVVQLAINQRCSPIVVVLSPKVAHVKEALIERFPKAPLEFAIQKEPRGTGDAVRSALPNLKRFKGNVVILYGDVPLLTTTTVGRLQKAAQKNAVAVLSAKVDDPTAYGRILREGKHVVGIVEHKDANKEQRQIDEINAGVYVFDSTFLTKRLGRLKANNAQGEFYLTDLVEMAHNEGLGATAVITPDNDEIRGVNSRSELATAERILRERLIAQHQANGVTFIHPESVALDTQVSISRDVTIGMGVQLRGITKVHEGAIVEGPCVIINSQIGPEAHIHSFSHIEEAKVGKKANVGPFARLRPGTSMDEGSRVGNFVELKKTRLGKGSKANHLAYLGDADIGSNANIGAGTITCNYDGTNKHVTKVGSKVFVGSNSTLVAPLDIGSNAYIAAGSTITQKVPAHALAFGRARQAIRKGYAKRLKERLKKEKA